MHIWTIVALSALPPSLPLSSHIKSHIHFLPLLVIPVPFPCRPRVSMQCPKPCYHEASLSRAAPPTMPQSIPCLEHHRPEATLPCSNHDQHPKLLRFGHELQCCLAPAIGMAPRRRLIPSSCPSSFRLHISRGPTCGDRIKLRMRLFLSLTSFNILAANG